MAIDPYQPCPCGIDKKIKFCCGAEVVAELNKVQEMLDGEQRLAAVDHINRFLEKTPGRPCLLQQKAMIQMGLQEIPAARQSAEQMLAAAPNNPVGLGILAVIECIEGPVSQGIAYLQQAFEAAQGKLPAGLYSILSMMGRLLAHHSELVPARALWLLQLHASDGRDKEVIRNLLQLDTSGELPLTVMQLDTLFPADASGRLSAAGIAQFNQALEKGGMGCWSAAARTLETLAEREPYEPAVWKNIGILRSWLGEYEPARAALRRYASFASIPRDEAVEMETVVQFLAVPAEADLVAEMKLSFDVPDPAALKEFLLSSRRFYAANFDPAVFTEAGQPPPLAVYYFMSGEPPATVEELTRENTPRIDGDLLLFGKQTDQPARVELIALATPDLPAKEQRLVEVCGSLLGPKQGEQVVDKVEREEALLGARLRLPNGVTPEISARLVEEFRQHSLLHIWPDIPLTDLNGRTARQAAADPSQQVRVLAAILAKELRDPLERDDYNQLRRQLGLPTLETIDPTGLKVASLSLPRCMRLDVAKLSDDDLQRLYARCRMTSCTHLLRRLTPELLARPSLEKSVVRSDLFALQAGLSANIDEALGNLRQAQEAAVKEGKSPAQYLLEELPLRLQKSDMENFQRIIERLMARHRGEPGVMQTLQSLLQRMGLIRPDGSVNTPPPGAGSQRAGQPAAAPSGGLWTPDQPASPAAGKSKLWVPGMD